MEIDRHSIETVQLNLLLSANRKAQAEINAKLAKVERMQTQIQKYREKMLNPPKSEDLADPLTRAVHSFIQRRAHPRLFFPPFFKNGRSIPPPNPHSTSENAQDYRLVKSIQIAQKPVNFHRSESISLRQIVFYSILADNPHLIPQIRDLFYLHTGSMEYSPDILENLLKKYGDLTLSWADYHWHIIAKEFPHRSSNECKWRWMNIDNPLLYSSNAPLSKAETKKLATICKKYNYADWPKIKIEFGGLRTVPSIFRLYKLFVWSHSGDKWKDEDTKKLLRLVEHFGQEWAEIATYFPNRTNAQCLSHFKCNDPRYVRGKWTFSEDELLLGAIDLFRSTHPESPCIRWSLVSEFVGTRNDTQCRNRFEDVLDAKWDKQEMSQVELKRLMEIVNGYLESGSLEGTCNGEISSVCRWRKGNDLSGGKMVVPWRVISNQFFPTRQDAFLRKTYVKQVSQEAREMKRQERKLNTSRRRKSKKTNLEKEDDENKEILER